MRFRPPWNLIFGRAVYRVGQLARALTAHPLPGLPADAAVTLSTREQALFDRMLPFDQRHCLAVWRLVRKKAPEDIDLQRAALLHDVGKGLPSNGQRVALVLANKLAPGSLGRWRKSRIVWLSQVSQLDDHARAGANLLTLAGSNRRVIDLVAGQPIAGAKTLSAADSQR